MNLDEVKALSDEELQIRVAMLRGAARTEKRNGCLQQYRFEDDMGFVPAWQPIPDYPNDIAAAWPLAEQAGLSVLRVGEEWWVGVFDGSNGDWWFVRDPMCDTNTARAITRAFVWVRTPEAT